MVSAYVRYLSKSCHSPDVFSLQPSRFSYTRSDRIGRSPRQLSFLVPAVRQSSVWNTAETDRTEDIK